MELGACARGVRLLTAYQLDEIVGLMLFLYFDLGFHAGSQI